MGKKSKKPTSRLPSMDGSNKDEDLPQVLEGLLPTDEILAKKRATGPKLVHNLGLIELEWCTHLDMTTPFPLDEFFRELETSASTPISEVSHSVSGLTSSLDLCKMWSILTRRAQVNREILWMQRTEENTPSILTLQRLEHLKHNVDEMSPTALIIIMWDVTLFINRDRFLERPKMLKMLKAAALNESLCSLCGEVITADTVAQLTCGDCFHSSCLEAWEKRDTMCPMCPICEKPIVRAPDPELPASAVRGHGCVANQPLSLEEHLAGLALIDALEAEIVKAQSDPKKEDEVDEFKAIEQVEVFEVIEKPSAE